MSWKCKQCGKTNDSNLIRCECGHKWSQGESSGTQAPSLPGGVDLPTRTKPLIAILAGLGVVAAAGYCIAGWGGVFSGLIAAGGSSLTIFCIHSYAQGKYDPESGESATRDVMLALLGLTLCLVGGLLLHHSWTEQYEKTGMRWHVPVLLDENPESLYLRGKEYCDKGDNAAGVPLILQALAQESSQSRDRARAPWVHEALYKLALLYANGANGIPKDSEETLKLFIKIAEDGNPDDQYELGTIYTEGKYSIRPNMAEAIRWYEKAASNHHETATDRLAEILYVQKDFKRALP